MNLSAFKAYDIRGKYPEEVNEDLAYAVGRALARYLGADDIVVGMDMRETSLALKKKVIEGLLCEGVDVIDIGLCTTPMLSFAVIHYGYDGGIMISASHDPGKENGFKLIDSSGVQIGEGFGLEDIRTLVEKGFGACSPQGTRTEHSILTDYLGAMLPKFPEIKGLNVVVDYSNGVGSIPGQPVFARLSEITTTEINEKPDGSFPSHPANPHDLENFKQLQKEVLDKGADLGLFFDGDADRVQVVDEEGQIVPMDLLFCLLAERELLNHPEYKGKEFYYDLRFSKVVPDIIKKLGGKPVMMRVGNPYYKKALQGGGALAVEFAGHVMFVDNHNIDDGLFCALKIMNLMSDGGRSLSERIAEIRKFATSSEVSLEAKNPDTLFDRIRAEYPTGIEIDLDGLYLDFPDGFISVRQSQNELQLFRLRVEAGTESEMQKRFEKIANLVRS